MKFFPIDQQKSIVFNFRIFLLNLLFLLIPLIVSAQEIGLFQQFNGRYDFTAIGNTLNKGDNICDVLTESSANLALNPTQTLLSANLYWAGPGGGDSAFPADNDVTLNGNPVTAERTFLTNFNGRRFFGAYADVTDIVNIEGNGLFTFSDLDLPAIFPGSEYCNTETDFGGWAIIIVYEDPALDLNQISLFDGLDYVSSSNTTLEIILGPLNVTSDNLAKIGFLAWEGDASLANGESLTINGTLIDNPPLNPGNNQFNGTNSYTNSTVLYNMDLDVYDLTGLVFPGDNEITINLTSNQDLVLIHNVITSVNSELPDATITFEEIEFICDDIIELEYTVSNINSTGPLPSGTPIAFYADGVLIGQSQTNTALPIDGSEIGNITLNITTGSLPDPFIFLAVVDDDGTGTSTVSETNEDNNEYQQSINLAAVTVSLDLGPDILIANNNAICEGDNRVLSIVSLTPSGANGSNSSYQWFLNGTIIPGETNDQLTVNQTGTYLLEVTYEGCVVTDNILVEFVPTPIAVVPNPLVVCDQVPNDGFADFNLTDADAQIINGQPNTFVTYHISQPDADAGINPLTSPYTNVDPTTQIVFARLEETVLGCFDVVELELQVDAAPAITDPISDYFICDNDQNGTEVFDLTSKYAEIVNTLPAITLTYYNTPADANAGTNPIGTPTNYNSAGAETIWVRAENAEGCTTISSFNLVLETVSFNKVLLFELCDDVIRDGFTEFDLDSQIPTITAGNTNLLVTYHLLQADADSGTNPLTSPYINIVNPETIFVRVEDTTTTCYGTFEMQLSVISIIAADPNPLVVCDQVPNDGFADFNLTDADAQIINGQPNTFVTYHISQPDADAGINPLTSPYTNVDPTTQIVFARLEETVLGCFDVVELELQVDAAPAITDPISDYFICDNDQNGTEVFDLTSKYAEIVNTLPAITLTYYNTPADANAGTNPIGTPTNYNSAGAETIWVRAENAEGCTTVSSFNLVIGLVPTYTEVLLFELCDDVIRDGFTEFDLDSQIPTITAGNTNLLVTYHLLQADADSGTNPLTSPYINIVNPETIFVRVEDTTTTCYGTFEMQLSVISIIAADPNLLVVCDQVPNDGFADFNLTDADAQIINGQPNTFVTYHISQPDADAGINSLTSPYTNVDPTTQIVFARLEETVLGCFDVVELELQVDAAPAITDPISDYFICDNDQNGTEVFDLTSKYAEIVNTLPAITLTYYNTPADANAGTNPIGTPTNYNSAGAETIWVRAENAEGCTTVSSFNLVIGLVPTYTEVLLFELCDDAIPDGFTEFDLDSQIPTITAGNTNLLVTYHESQADADSGTNSLTSPYNNIVNPETIFVRVEDTTTTCYGTFEMQLVVNPLPSPVTPSNYVICDEDNDGFVAFDLTSKDIEIIGGETGVVISYHVSGPEADTGTNPLTSPYINTSTPTQTIFARAEFTTTGCYQVVDFELIINPTPVIPSNITDLNLCDINLDGIEFFDLTQRANEIYGPQDPLDFTLSYYINQTDAQAGINEITNPDNFQNTGNPQTIWVRLEDNLTGCFSIGSFVIDFIFCPLPDATIEVTNIGVFCTSSNLDIEYTVFNTNSTGPLPANTPIAFYANNILIGQSQTINVIPIDGIEVVTISLFIPIGTPFIFTLKAVVDDDGTGIGIVGEENETNNEFEIVVDLDGETINLGPDIESCIGDTVVLDADLGAPGFNYQWFLNNVLIPGATNPLLSVTTNGTYRIDATEGACFVTGEIFINFNPPPIAIVPNPLVVCDQVPNDGFADFNLTDADAQIINGQPNTFVTYHISQPDADAGINPLTSPYTNVDPTTQIVFARLEDTPVGCFDIVPLTLQVDAAPTITNPISDYFICDNDQNNNEIFDLTSKYAEIVNTLPNIILNYYNTQTDAETDTNAIATPNSYNSSGGETIWVRAENAEGCITIGSFLLISGTVPTFTDVPIYQLCDDIIRDGITEFDLESQTPTIIAGDTNLIVTYHLLQIDAESNLNSLTSPYTNSINPETIFVRVEDATTGCFIVFDMLLDVISIIAADPNPLVVCDQVPNDGFADFNLTDADAQIINGQPNTFVTYHISQPDADAGINPLTSPYTNVDPTTQIVFARLEETVLGCFDVVELELQVDAAPAITDPISDYFICDNDQNGTEVFDLTSKYAEIVNTLPAITLTYYNTPADANAGTNPIGTPTNYNSAGAETIWVRAENAEGCTTVSSFNLVIGLVPTYTEVLLFELCDDVIRDGFTEFDLDSQIPTITAGNTNLLVTYHLLQADADSGTNPLTSPYINIVNPETIFVRVEDTTTTCYGTFEMQLSVISIIAADPNPLVVCDQVPNDGFADFNLTDADAQIINGQPNTFVTYHISQPDADAGINPLTSPYTNVDPTTQIVFARLEETVLGCFDVVELELQVDAAPAITDPISDYPLCDNDEDGVEVFDLTSKYDEIVNILLNITLTYYNTQADADADTNPIATPTNYISAGAETIWVRAINLEGCTTVSFFNLVIETVPIYTEVPLYELCDDGISDGFTEFDLESQTPTIIAGDFNLIVTYHISQADADTGSNPLISPYINTTDPETIFVRVEDATTGCYGSFEMILDIISPIAIEPDPLIYCDPASDGFGEFTLTDADSQVTGGIPTGNLQVTYHYLLEDAQNGANPLPSPYLNDVPFNQTVFVRLLDQSTGCYGTTTLELIVLQSPQIIEPTDLEVCDDDGDGIVIFDLTVSEPELLNGLDPTLYTITYFEDAGLTIPIANPTAYANTPPSPQTIYIVVEDIANECRSQTTLLLWVYLPPVLVAPLPYELCDVTEITGPDDELEPFDLDSATTEITGGDLNINITYHETQADADAGTNPLVSPYTNLSNPQTIFIRGEDSNNLCTVSLGVTLDLVVNPLPSPVTPTPLEVCDEDNDGLALFILTDKDIEIIGGEPGVQVTYHETLLDAEAGVFALTSPYANTQTFVQIVYARAEYPIALGGTGCFRIVELELRTNPTPIIPIDIPDLVICDDDDFAIFDLTERAGDIYGAQDPADYALTYYTSLADADAGINAIANPTAFPNTTNPQTIWVRLEDNTTACIKIGSFELIVELVPIFTPIPTFEQCDDEVQDGFTAFDLNLQNGIITGGDPTLGVTYYPTQLDADDATNPLTIPYTNTVNPETIYVRIESGVTGCYGTFPMDLVVVPAPSIFQPTPLEFCDPDNDGFGEFMLTDADLEVTGGIPTGNLIVSYHYLLEDAINNVLPLPTAVPYLNDVPFLQTVHVRLVDQTTGCYSLTTLDLVVLDSPQIVPPTDMILCDDDGDGIEVFDLTLSEAELLNGLDPTLYTITYYEDAALTFAIANPAAYSNTPPSPQTIYIVVEDIANECRSQTTLLLWVVAAPTLISPTALELCDMTEITGPDDELEPFDLESKTDEITGGNPAVGITYYETQADADAGINALTSPYINTSNPQTIFIRAEDQDTNCIISQGITLSLVVNPLPSPVTPTALEVCDVDNDGFASFTLTDKDAEIIGGEPGVVVSYYETLLDAEAAVFALTSPYTNIVTPSQIIYARAEFPLPPAGTGTGCFRIVELELLVNPTPIIPLEIDDLVICDDDGFSIFDLTQRADAIYGTQDPADYTLTYHISQADAEAGADPIANPTAFPNTTNPQIIWVRLEDNITGCPKIGSFEIRSELGPQVFQPTPLTLCDDLGEPNDGVTLFDLTVKNDEITGAALGVTVHYYETQADAQADINVIDPDTAYQNTSNPQIIWARVADVNTLCVDTTVSLTLRVEANPDPEDPDPIILCDVTNPGDMVEVFDLTIREAQILDGETWDVSYYNSFEDAVANNAAIAVPTAYTNTTTPEIVYVRVSIDLLDAAACFEIVELELIVNPIPDDSVVVEDYIICEIPADGEAVFDLTSKIDEILNGQDPAIFQVLFYESQAEADAMINPIQNPDTYTNIANPQTIYVVILNMDTDCFVSTQNFEIEEREGAIANTPLEPYAICDYYNENDGIAEFDLLDQDLLDEILAAQDPLVYQLDFYGTLENAELEVSPLPTTYVNVINPQVIYARVTNINSECYDITEVILKVELIPEVALDESYRLCVDAAGNPIPAEEGSASPPVIDTGLDPSIYMFEWQLNGEVLLGEIGASITALQEGTYSVTVTEILTGCFASTSTQVVTSSPPLIYDVEVSQAFASQHNIIATAEGGGEYVFQLDDNPFQESGYFANVLPGNHTVTIKDIYGCGSVTIEVGVIDYPQFMTPNQDGYHDTWNIIGIANGDPTAKIYIFDRYGKLLKQLSPLTEGWDGSYNGNPMPSSDYWFRVEYTENDTKKEFRGHFTLKR